MTNQPDLNQIGKALETFQDQITRAQATATNEAVRRQLTELGPRLKQAQTEFITEYPKTMAAVQKSLDDVTSQAKAAENELEQLRKKIQDTEAAKKAAAATRPQPAPDLDPNLGRTLRQELLQRFGEGASGWSSGAYDPALKERLKKLGLWPK